jgi:hypothetical protein
LLGLGLLSALAVGACAAPPPSGGPARCSTAATGARYPHVLVSESELAAIAARAPANAASIRALYDECDRFVGGKVLWPNPAVEETSVEPPDLAEGYQGSAFLQATLNLGLCVRLAPLVPPLRPGSAPRSWALVAVDVLAKMSETTGPHAVDPLRDSGYGIRNYVIGLAVGYDWLHEWLDPTLRARIAAAIERWLAAFEKDGFGHVHPQGNYFAGYYAAKALAALALAGSPDAAHAPHARWADFVALHDGFVAPYYAKHLVGGGWPEGWNYGHVATINMGLPFVASRVAADACAIPAPIAPLAFTTDQADELVHFAWPTQQSLDDRGWLYTKPNPAPADPRTYAFQALALRRAGDARLPVFQRFAREVRERSALHSWPWLDVIGWDASGSEAPYAALPRSYLSRGMQTAAMRSSWERDAIWASFTSGPYVGYSGAGEMFFDQGSLAIVHGGERFLVNTVAALLATGSSPPAASVPSVEKEIFRELFGKRDEDPTSRQRTIFNVFYAGRSAGGQCATPVDTTRTRMGAFDDGGEYVFLRGEALEDMYCATDEERTVARWDREVVYLRPGRFVLHDRTRTRETPRDPHPDRWLAFHFAGEPVSTPSASFVVSSGDHVLGSGSIVLPAAAKTSVVDVFGRHKVYRLEVRPPAPSDGEETWLTFLDALDTSTRTSARALAAEGHLVGAVLEGGSEREVVAFARGLDGALPDGPLRYAAPPEATFHVVTGLAPGTVYTVSTTAPPLRVTIATAASGLRSSHAGVLRFRTDGSGRVW